MFPASIIVYAPPHSAPARIEGLAAVLRKAGHSPLVVTDRTGLADAFGSGKYDLVLAGLEHSSEIAGNAKRASSAPDIIPVLVRPTKSDLAAAKTLSVCRITAPSDHKNDALAEIDHRMELRLKAREGERDR